MMRVAAFKRSFRFAAEAIALVALAGFLLSAAAANTGLLRVRVGFSNALFENVNENDASAAMTAWLQTVTASSHLEVESLAQLMPSEEIVRSIANHSVDVFSITTPEYAKVAQFVDPVIFMDEFFSKHGTEYLLLVRQDSGIHDLPGLRGRHLVILRHIGMVMAGPWLDTLLAGANLESADRFFGQVTTTMKVAQTVLPVYFGSVDACLVTRQAFDTMSELNPQLARKLRVLAVSPKQQVAMVGIHKNAAAEIKSRMREALLGLHNSPSGRQLLTLFYCERMIAVDSSLLRDSVDLQAAYDRLKARRAGGSR